MLIKRIVRSGKFYKVVTELSEISILNDSTITDFKLFVGLEIDDDLVEKIKLRDLENYYYNRAIYLLSRRQRSEYEIKTYLKQKLYDQKIDTDTIIEKIVERLKRYNYLNDIEFAKWWIDNRVRNNRRGPRLISSELLQKGIDRVTIQNILDEVDSDQIDTACLDLAKKKISSIKAKDDKERISKLTRYLLGKGFEWKTIKKTLDII